MSTTNTTPLAPSATETAANQIDSMLAQALQLHKNTINKITRVLTQTRNPDGSLVTAEEIIASRPRFASLQGYLDNLKGSVGILSPGGTPGNLAPAMAAAQKVPAAPLGTAATS